MNKTFDDLLFPDYIQKLEVFNHQETKNVVKKQHLDEIVDKSFLDKYFSNLNS